MNFWFIAVAFLAFYLIHLALSARQMKNFSATFTELRRRGPVLIGKRKNLLSWGAIVLLRLDGAAVVAEGRVLTGATVFSRFHQIDRFNAVPAAELSAAALSSRDLPRPVRLAVANAAQNWAEHTAGRTPLEPAGPVQRLFARASS